MQDQKQIALLRDRQIRERLAGIGRTTFWSIRKKDDFPRPVQLGGTKAWRSDEVDAWIASRQRA